MSESAAGGSERTARAAGHAETAEILTLMWSTLATPLQRLGAWIIDVVIVALVLTPLNPALYSSRPSALRFTFLWAAAMIVLFLYLALLDGGPRGATLGKRIVGIRVVDADRPAAIGYRRGVVRTLVLFIGGIAFYVGWLVGLSDPRRQAWHDKVADSLVVRTR